MKKVWVLFILAFLLISCGEANKNDNEPKDDGSDTVIGEMAAVLKESSPLVFQYGVKNLTEKDANLEFSNSQRFDYSVEKMSHINLY